MNMSSERNLNLIFHLKRAGAHSCSPRTSWQLCRCSVACFVRSSSVKLGCSGGLGGPVASFRAGLRLSLPRRCGVASHGLVSVCVAALRDISRLRQAHLLQAALLPNNSLVPTLETKVRFVSVSSGAAQLKR